MELKRIDYSTALLAKEVGFNEPDHYLYNTKRNGSIELFNHQENVTNEHLNNIKVVHEGYYYNNTAIVAPTQALLQQWLRVKHNIIVYVEYDFDYTKTNYRGVIRVIDEIGKPKYIDSFEFEYTAYLNGVPTTAIAPSNIKYTNDYATYEEALEEVLVIGLNLLKL